MDAAEATSRIRDCFSLADEIVLAALTSGKFAPGERLTIVGSNFYGSYWSAPQQSRREKRTDDRSPSEVLTEVLQWLKNPPPNNSAQQTSGA
jgi:hypothetical protein